MFLQRGHTDGQQVHKKVLSMLIIISHLLEWLLSKRQEITSVGEDVEKREPSCAVGGNVNWCSHCGKQYGESLKN